MSLFVFVEILLQLVDGHAWIFLLQILHVSFWESSKNLSNHVMLSQESELFLSDLFLSQFHGEVLYGFTMAWSVKLAPRIVHPVGY